MKSKPNPFLHMMIWGFFSGAILGLLFLVFIFMGSQNILNLFLRTDIWQYALLYGGVPGLAFGLMNGFILWLIMRGRPMPFGRGDMKAARWLVYGLLFGLTLIVAYALSMIVLGWPSFTPFWNRALVFPPIIAAIAFAYAGHRYLFRLRLWSEQAYGLRKEKAKNDALGHLEDKPQNESYLSPDEDLENEQQL